MGLNVSGADQRAMVIDFAALAAPVAGVVAAGFAGAPPQAARTPAAANRAKMARDLGNPSPPQTDGDSSAALRVLLHAVAPGGRLLRAWHPPGQISPRVTALEIELPGGVPLRVIARHTDDAAKEYRLLGVLAATGLPVPRPLALVDGVVVTEYVDGLPDLAAPPARMAELLVRIHRAVTDPAWMPAMDGPPAVNRPALLHGDIWPGNVLWRDGQPVAIIDWEDAARGDPLADVANSRLEVVWARGAQAMRAFTNAYRSAMDLDYRPLPRWDLQVARRQAAAIGGWGFAPRQLRRMRAQLGWFARQAVMATRGE